MCFSRCIRCGETFPTAHETEHHCPHITTYGGTEYVTPPIPDRKEDE